MASHPLRESGSGPKRTFSQLVAYDGGEFLPIRRLGSAAKGLGMFDVSYHETFDFFWIKSALRRKAHNFLCYDFD